jgi:hypothetical protein
VGYLLLESHPGGRAKAAFFRAVGFTEANAPLVREGLLSIALTGEVAGRATSPYGIKYVVDGPLPTPVRGDVRLRTVWIIEAETAAPRFVTAYPAQGGAGREEGRG